MEDEDSAWLPGADERITEFIADLLKEPSVFVAGWTLMVTYHDSDGEKITFNCMEGQRVTATLGQLTHALEVQRAAIFWEERPE